MSAILPSKLRSNLKVRSPFTPPLLKAPPLTLILKFHPYNSKLLTKVRELLVSHLKGWKGRNVLSSMILCIFNLIIPIERHLPPKIYKRFELLRENLVKENREMMSLL